MAGVNPLAFRREELFSAFLDGELEPLEVELVNELLAADSDAIEDFRAVQKVRKAVRDLPYLEIPSALLPGGHLGDRLSAYLDGELSIAEAREVSDHVIRCGECRDELHELDRARIAVRSLPGMETAELDAIPAPSRSRRKGAIVAGGVGIAAAVALFVALGLPTDGPEPAFSLEDLTTQHIARASAEPGFTVFPPAIEVSSP